MEPRPSTVPEIEFELQRALCDLREIDERGELPRALKPLLSLAPPAGASVHVSLRERDSGRPIRPGTPTHAWSSRGFGAWIVFELAAGLGTGNSPARNAGGDGVSPMRDFVLALDHVEKDPHLRFVSLKWFRDTYLPKRGYDWASDPDIPRQVVHEAAESEVILTAKVPNPKTPEFPVTTIRLNREHALVKALLADEDERTAARAPVDEAPDRSSKRPVEA
jgi:hypothetical protein